MKAGCHYLLFCTLVIKLLLIRASPLQSPNISEATHEDFEDLPILIPDTSSLNSDALQSVGADKFLTLWHMNVLSGPVVVSDEPWTVLAPLNSGLPKDPSFIVDKQYSREVLLNHVILGDIVNPDLASLDPNFPFYSLADSEMVFSKKGDTFYINGIRLTGQKFDYPNGVLFVIEKTVPLSRPDYLKYVPELKGNIFDSFNSVKADKQVNDPPAVNSGIAQTDKTPTASSRAPASPKTTIAQFTTTSTRFDRFRNRDIKESVPEATIPPSLVYVSTMKQSVTELPTTEATTEAEAGFMENFFLDIGSSSGGPTAEEFNVAPSNGTNETFLDSLILESKIKNAISHEFVNHFMEVHLDQLLDEDNEYTVIIPTDDAFYDYYPIDWGFNPFLVDNFTQQVLLNHLIPGNVDLHNLPSGTELMTLGGGILVVSQIEDNRTEINGHLIPPEFDLEVPKGRIYYVDTLFFVNYDRVNALRDTYPYLETGPLISFPWPTSPFLSHLVKRLQENSGSQIFAKLLLRSSIAHRVSSSDKNLQRLSYTAFIPSDDALRTIFSEEQISSLEGKILEASALDHNALQRSLLNENKINTFLMNHIFHRYIFEEDMVDGFTISSIAGNEIPIKNQRGNIFVGGAKILGEQQFLYNLGAIYMVDNIISDNAQPVTAYQLATSTQRTLEPVSQVETSREKPTSHGISVPFPAELASTFNFPSMSDPEYRFETRTEISFSRQINNGEIVPVPKEEIERFRNYL